MSCHNVLKNTAASAMLAGFALAPISLAITAGSAKATVLTTSDGVIRNSLCVGFDCPNAPTFGDSTILLMENNTRIKFGDTSVGAFPANDWEIEANSSVNGGQSYLGFNDCGSADNDGGCATDLVFAVEAGARQSALYVESDGDIGIGTSNPVVDIHVVTGNTPTLRLDQDGSSGFAPQVWDVAGNETNFFIRDVTNGSRLPFRIRPDAPTSSIFIDTDGDVGMGTSSPDALLDIEDSANLGATDPHVKIQNTNATQAVREMLRMVNNGGSYITLENTASARSWFMIHENNASNRLFLNRSDNVGANLFTLDGSGNVTITGSLVTTGGGGACTVGDPCDAVFDPAVYTVPSIEEHAAVMWRNRHLPAVGPTGPGQPIDVTEKMLRMLNELEHAHIYIAQLNERIAGLETTVAALK